MIRFTINRALIFAATCSVAAHGSFVLLSGGFAQQSSTPSIDRDGGTQTSELIQVAGVLSAEITAEIQPEHLKPVETERPDSPDPSAEKLRAEADTTAPDSETTSQATIEYNNDPPAARPDQPPLLDASHKTPERVVSSNNIRSDVVPEGLATSVSPNGKSIKLLAQEVSATRTDADTLATSKQDVPESTTSPVIEPAAVTPVRTNPPPRELPAHTVSNNQLARTTPRLEQVIDPMPITIPNRGNANDTAVSNSSTGEKQLPRISKNQDPKYPSLLLAKGIGGVVRLRVLVNQDGLVDQLNVDRSSGHKAFDDAAIQAVRVWEFDPAVQDGKSVSMEIIVPIRFKPVK